MIYIILTTFIQTLRPMRQKLRQLRLMRSKALIEVEIKYFIDRGYVAAGTLIFQINAFLYRKVKSR